MSGLAIMVALAVIASDPALTHCLSYAGESVIQGRLTRHTFAEQPNYESIAKGDAAATYFFVEPAAPLCMAEGDADDDELEPAEAQVRRVQLVLLPRSGASYDSLRPYLGKPVRCRGALFHAITGHHHSPVLLDVTRCEPAP